MEGSPNKNDIATAAAAAEQPVVASQVQKSDGKNLKEDKFNFLLLILLYTMQGISLGFTASALPIILQSKNSVSFEDQALFSFVLWPNSMRLIWAPLVDAIYVPWIGRRKSWLIPVQYLMGTCLIYSACNIDNWLPDTGKPNVLALTYVFLIINLLAAIQNIVVDGWALTLLKKANVGYSSTSSTSGIALGSMLGSIVPVLLTSEDFNKNIQNTSKKGGIITLEKYLLIWGVVIILLTTIIGIFKKEKDIKVEDNHVKLNIIQNYKLLWEITKLPSIRGLLVALFTMKFGLAGLRTSLVTLKLVDIGIPKDDIMVLSTVMFAVKILVPIFVSKYTSGSKPLSVCLNVIPVRLIWCCTYIYFIYYTPKLIYQNGILDIPIYYYIVLGILNAINDSLLFIMIAATGSFFSRISDPRFGGTYMTLLNAISNFGFVWASTLGLKCIDLLTFKSCSNNYHNSCSTADFNNVCNKNGGHCLITIDGYYVEVIISIIFVIIWYCRFKNILKGYENKSPTHWMVKNNNESNKEMSMTKDCICTSSG